MNKRSQVIVLLHPHFTLHGGAGKYAMEVLQLFTPKYRVITIGQRVAQWWREQYSTIEFIDLHGPLTSSVWYWLLWPWWYRKTSHHLNRIAVENGRLILINSVFPAHWIGLLYKRFHPWQRTLWFCQEPSAFIYYRTWQNAINNPVKRLVTKLIAPIFKLIDQTLVKRCDVMIVNSRASQQKVQTIYHRTGIVAYGGVQKNNILTRLIADRPKHIMSVARLTRFKRIDVLIDAFIQANLMDYTLDIYGDGEEREHLEQKIAAAHYTNRIQIHNNASDWELAQAYASARLFVLCSRDEPFGIVVVEAMACGTPVIADATGGPAEIVINEVTGRLIHVEVSTLRDTLQTVLPQIAILQSWSDAARTRADQDFTWQATANLIQQYL